MPTQALFSQRNVTDSAPLVITVFGWIIIYLSNLRLQKKKIKLDLQVKAAEEAINRLSQFQESIINVSAHPLALYKQLNSGVINQQSPADVEVFIQAFNKSSLELYHQDFYSHFHSRAVIFRKFSAEYNRLLNDKLAMFNEIQKLLVNLMNKTFTAEHPNECLSKPAIAEFKKEVKGFLELSKQTLIAIFTLQNHLQNEYLAKIFGKKIPELTEEEIEKIYDFSVLYK